MDNVLILFSTSYTPNEYGVDIPSNTRKEVFCKKKSITRNEFFEAGRNGLNPQFMFEIFKGEYAGESICEYNGQTYAIYRVFETDGDYIELYVERKGGTNGEESNP